MTEKDRKRLLARDQEQCWHCGTTENLTVQHRVNRGMGGSKKRDNPANLILLCWFVNFEMEASSRAAESARLAGWKVDGATPPNSHLCFTNQQTPGICLMMLGEVK